MAVELIENMNLTELIAAIYIAAMIIYGYHKGLIRMSMGIVSLILSIVATKMYYPVIKQQALQNDGIKLFIEERTKQVIAFMAENLESSDTYSMFSDKTKLLYKYFDFSNIASATVEGVVDAVITIIASVVVFIAIRLMISILFRFADRIFRLPVLNLFNRLTGALFSGVEALIWIWIIMLLIAIFPDNELAVYMSQDMQNSTTLLFHLRQWNIFNLLLHILI